MGRSPTFCIVPWVQLATNATGRYRVCCNSVPGINLILDSNDKPMVVEKNTIQEAWNSKTYKKLREELIAGKRPDMCQRCFREEDSGVRSARQRWNEKYQSEQEQNPNPKIDVRYIDLRLGNLCNLKCRMCNPYASSKWVDEWNKVADTAELVPNNLLPDSEIERLKGIDWPDKDETWKNLEPILSTIEEIYLTGGEPLLSLKQVDFLTKLVNSGQAKEIKLKYNTNLTVLPKSLLKIWPEFKSVVLNVSVDGVGALDEYIRNPTQWNRVEENLRKLHSLEAEYSGIELGIHTTVQMYNILRLSEVIQYFEKSFGRIPYLNILNHPQCLNIRTLPLDLKNKAKESLEDWINQIEVQEVISYMLKEDWTGKYLSEFIDYTRAIDKTRNENILSLIPEFSNLFEKES